MSIPDVELQQDLSVIDELTLNPQARFTDQTGQPMAAHVVREHWRAGVFHAVKLRQQQE